METLNSLEKTQEYEIYRVLGGQEQIRAVTHELTVEFRDLDEITTKGIWPSPFARKSKSRISFYLIKHA